MIEYIRLFADGVTLCAVFLAWRRANSLACACNEALSAVAACLHRQQAGLESSNALAVENREVLCDIEAAVMPLDMPIDFVINDSGEN